MPSYTLDYFDFTARGEIIRLMFAEAGVKLEDNRISFGDWPKNKPDDLPFGKLPVLRIDGKPLPQTGAIIRYLAREFNLNAENSLMEAYTDMILEQLDDSIYKFAFLEPDEKKKAQLNKEALEKHVYPTFDKIEQKFKDRCGEFLMSKDKLTYADFAIFHSLEFVELFDKGIKKKYPSLNSLCERLAQRPKIKSYLDARKPMKF